VDLIAGAALAACGLLAGALNTIAGGGSVLTVPTLMAIGLPADVANASNRLAIATQSLAAVVAFARKGAIERRAVLRVVALSATGAALGATAAARVPAAVLQWVLLGVMLGLATLLLVRPDAVVAKAGREPRWDARPGLAALALLGCALYGGFVQAGVGFLLVGVLSGVIGYPIAEANGLKAVAALVFGSVSLAIFVAHGLVAWVPAAVLAVSSAIGALLGVRLALAARPRAMRWVLFVGVALTSIAAILRG
jgi:hypothetical protein